MTPEEADKLEEGAKLHLKYTMNGKLDVKVEYLSLIHISDRKYPHDVP